MSDDPHATQRDDPRDEPTPQELLASVAALRRRTRAARHAYWLPLVLFGVLMAAAAPLYVESQAPAELRATIPTPALAGLGGDLLERSAAIGWYWLVALIGGYLLSLAWYRWHGQRVGAQTPTRAYLTAGIVGTLVALLLPLVLRFLLLNTASEVSDATRWVTSPLLGVAGRGMLPHLVIAVGLAVLAHLERSRVLWVVVASYAATLLVVNLYFHTADLGSADVNRHTYMLAALLPAPVLLVGAAVALVGTSTRARRAG